MGNSVVLPTPVTIPFTTYKQYRKSEGDEYMKRVLNYNSQFTSIASWDGQQVLMQRDPAMLSYAPPRKAPWIGSEVDVIFELDIKTYNNQLKRFKEPQNRLDERMVKVLNTPPTPQPPPEYIILSTGKPAKAEEPNAVLAILPDTPAITPTGIETKINETDPNRLIYIKMYFFGRQYLVPNQTYSDYVKYSPPAAGASYEIALEHFLVLYEQIRNLWSINSGGEVFSFKFIAPVKKEGFINISNCVDVNTAQENWYMNQIIDIEGKKNLQKQFCESKRLAYDASNCGIRKCSQPLNNTSLTNEDDEPGTGLTYKYNQIKFSGSAYPTPIDNTAYQKELTLNVNMQLEDIDKYYTSYNSYNFFWLNQHGWRNTNKDKPYNPPIAPWIDTKTPAGDDKRFLDAIRAFNTNAIKAITKLNNYESINLQTEFGDFPEPPVYPNTLYDAMTKPTNYMRPEAAKGILVSSDSTKTQINYQIPVNQVSDIFKALKENPPPPPPAPTKPKCSTKDDASGAACILYDEDVSEAAKKLLNNMKANSAKRVSSIGIDYAMSKPKVPDYVIEDKLSKFYDTIRPDLLANVQSMIGRN